MLVSPAGTLCDPADDRHMLFDVLGVQLPVVVRELHFRRDHIDTFQYLICAQADALPDFANPIRLLFIVRTT